MNIIKLIKNAERTSEPVFTGQWGTLIFRPDLGSQQEFILGVMASLNGDNQPHFKWIPSLQKLSSLYGDALLSNEVFELIEGTEHSIRSLYSSSQLLAQDTGTPHMRIEQCGYFATHDIDSELTSLLKRHAGAIWAEITSREATTGDDWAYSLMRQTVSQAMSQVFVPNRAYTVANKTFDIALDNGDSFGNIVSARFANIGTIDRHVNAALRQLLAARQYTVRANPGSLFVVLPNPETSVQQMLIRKTNELLEQIQDIGVRSYSHSSANDLGRDIEQWAVNSSSK